MKHIFDHKTYTRPTAKVIIVKIDGRLCQSSEIDVENENVSESEGEW